MPELRGHCPYVGLKQNRAIRFASPTQEHRCYIRDTPDVIPVDQNDYCLSPNHIHCPLYTGSFVSTTPSKQIARDSVQRPIVTPLPGLRGWLAGLAPRDRLIYALMLILLASITGIYLLLSWQALRGEFDGSLGGQTLEPTVAPLPTTGSPADATLFPTVIPDDNTAVPVTSVAATRQPIAPTNGSGPRLATLTPTPLVLDVGTSLPQAGTPIVLPTNVQPSSQPAPRVNPSRVPTRSMPTRVVPTAIPPTAIPPTDVLPPTPVSGPDEGGEPGPLPPTPASSAKGNAYTEVVTLYFGDTTGTLFVPVQRTTLVVDNQVATAAIRELLSGPRTHLQSLVLPDTRLLSLQIKNGLATVNFDRAPTGQGDIRGYYAIVLTLTEFPTINEVQIQINNQPLTIHGTTTVKRPTVNPLNPDQLPNDVAQTSFLPLYFVSRDSKHLVRVMRMVPKTKQTAEATLLALLTGPGDYEYATYSPLPGGVELRGLRLQGSTLIVDFTNRFLDAPNREHAVTSVVQSVTSLPTIARVQFLVEGESLGTWWGVRYGQVFGRMLINPDAQNK
jgi:spore germination protein GerM